MTINRRTLQVDDSDLDRVEELVRYLAAHDGRLPTDDMPLSWWLVEALDLPQRAPLRVLLAGIPIMDISRPMSPKRAATWQKFVVRLNQLDWMSRRGEGMEDDDATDLGKWAESTVARYLSGSMKPVEELLLRKREAWSFERPLSPKKRGATTFNIGLKAIKSFHWEHGHTDVPDGIVVDGVNLRVWWQSARGRYAANGLTRDERQRLAALKLDLRTDKQIAKDAAALEREEKVLRAQEAKRRNDPNMKVMEAVKVFAQQHGHTGIPVGATTDEGLEFGRIVDEWRRQYVQRNLSSAMARRLRAIDRWTWMRTPVSPNIQRPAPVSIPEDTTQMRKSGLRQFLPGD